ncbi:MAG TPA: DUF445 domain-containing protein [Janthinobacterium sp.]|jgi:uncharacterized membrane-anchored protein YjiN (DUF445 family)|nr:DUF445 domain-containing protein [Janthinobacterium sp.]
MQTTPASPQEIEQLRQLKRMRSIATGLVALMALLFLGARLLQPHFPLLAFAAAFAEAALVGALADWFAVTALFRRPFGLPIPHTAIIPNNKDRIGESVGAFLEHNFMTYEVLREELATVDFAGTVANWLGRRRNARAVAQQVVGSVPALLRLIDDEDAGQFVRKAMAASLKDVRFAPLLAQVLSVLVAGRQHHLLLERILGIVARALEENRPYIRQKVHENSPRWIPKVVDEKFFERLMDGVQGILAEIQGEDSEWRDRFQAATEELIAKLANSPEYEEKLQALIGKSLGHPLFREYVGQVWADVRQRLLADATAPDSRLAARLEEALRVFSQALAQDAPVRDKLNHWLRQVVADTVVGRRDVIAAVVTRAIRKWDAETVSRKLELQVGKDLQYIRINGTLVGGLVGLLLHVISLFL